MSGLRCCSPSSSAISSARTLKSVMRWHLLICNSKLGRAHVHASCRALCLASDTLPHISSTRPMSHDVLAVNEPELKHSTLAFLTPSTCTSICEHMPLNTMPNLSSMVFGHMFVLVSAVR